VTSLATAGATHSPTDPGRLTLALDRVVVFKDGYGLFVKTATGTADAEGRVFTESVPDGAVLGCFWATSEDPPVRSMRAEWIERTEEKTSQVTCLSVRELLRANQGRRVVLELDDRQQMPCTVVELLERSRKTDLSGGSGASDRLFESGRSVGSDSSLQSLGAASAADYFASSALPSLSSSIRVLSSSDSAISAGTTIKEVSPEGGDLLVVETGDGVKRILRVDEIRRLNAVDSLSTQVARHETVVTRAKRLTMDLGPDAAGREVSIRLLYFTEGIRWIPTYRLEGALEEDGNLTLQGEILNEVEPIENVALDLIVGVPNFRFKNTPSPLSLERTLRRTPAFQQLNIGNNVMMSQFANSYQSPVMASPESRGEGLPDLAPSLQAEGAMDLFAYSLDSFSLGKGGRAAVQLWASDVPIRHVYTLDLRLIREASGKLSVQSYDVQPAPGGDSSPLRFNVNRVWHQLELANHSTVPWTTGAAFLLRNGLPLGQDILTYTSPKGQTLLPVTIAVDVKASYDDEELERKPNALRWANSDYAMIRQRGTITIKNARSEAISIRPTVTLGGRAEQASDDGTIRIGNFDPGDWNNSSYGAVNNRSTIAWTLTLEPGETRTLTFDYFYYIR